MGVVRHIPVSIVPGYRPSVIPDLSHPCCQSPLTSVTPAVIPQSPLSSLTSVTPVTPDLSHPCSHCGRKLTLSRQKEQIAEAPAQVGPAQVGPAQVGPAQVDWLFDVS